MQDDRCSEVDVFVIVHIHIDFSDIKNIDRNHLLLCSIVTEQYLLRKHLKTSYRTRYYFSLFVSKYNDAHRICRALSVSITFGILTGLLKNMDFPDALEQVCAFFCMIL